METGPPTPSQGSSSDHDPVRIPEQVLETVRESIKAAERRARLDLDVRGILAIIAISGLLAVIFIQLFQGLAISIPAELAAVAGSVTGFYFGSRAGGSNGERRH